MYAQPRYLPRQPRTIGLGAAFLVNGAIIAGVLLFLAPTFVVKPKDPPLVIGTIEEPAPPPPIDEPKPRTDPRVSTEPPIVTPIPRIESDTTDKFETTTILPSDPPGTGAAEGSGPTTVIADPPVPPLAPLVNASQDPRFARDFQPQYPPSELRAQRDGQVAVRVLIGVDGRVKAIEQVRATSSAFFEATRRQALAKWRFKPANRGGVPEESWKNMTVSFRLQNL